LFQIDYVSKELLKSSQANQILLCPVKENRSIGYQSYRWIGQQTIPKTMKGLRNHQHLLFWNFGYSSTSLNEVRAIPHEHKFFIGTPLEN